MAIEVPQKLWTIGKIADHLHVPVHRVRHILKTRRHIQYRALAGLTRLFDAKAVAQIRHEITAVDARRADWEGGDAE